MMGSEGGWMMMGREGRMVGRRGRVEEGTITGRKGKVDEGRHKAAREGVTEGGGAEDGTCRRICTHCPA